MAEWQTGPSLLFDRLLHRRLSAIGPGAAAVDWEAAVYALNIRSMEHLAAEVAERGLEECGSDEGLWYEYILAASLFPEKLRKAWERISDGLGEKPGFRVLLSLVDYYLERDSAGLRRLRGVPPEAHSFRYHEVLGHYAMSRQAFQEALQSYRRAHRESPRDPRLCYHLGESYRALGENALALQWLYRAVRKERQCVRAWNALCRIHLETGQAELARQAMGMALSINPKDWGVYFTLADHYLDRSQFRRAHAVLEDVLDMSPKAVIAAEVYNYLGYLKFREGNYPEAIPSFERALSLNPHLSVTWFNLGNLHFRRKNLDEAVRCYLEALRTDGHNGGAATQLGLTYLEQGRPDMARKPLERALAIDPADHWAHLGLSEYHRRTRNPIGAMEEAREALRIEPSDPNVHNYLGIALEYNRRYFEAEKAYRRALQLDPMHRWAANNLGYLCEKLVRLDAQYHQAAIEAWKRRLLICRDTKASIRGALNHLQKLGVTPATLRKWITSEPGPVPAGGAGPGPAPLA